MRRVPGAPPADHAPTLHDARLEVPEAPVVVAERTARELADVRECPDQLVVGAPVEVLLGVPRVAIRERDPGRGVSQAAKRREEWFAMRREIRDDPRVDR